MRNFFSIDPGRHLVFLLSILMVVGCTEKKSETRNKPNFIIIYADDLGYGDIGCFGAGDIKTPHIDRLAEEGVRFTSFYSVSPVCSPSRAGLLTGRYPVRMGITEVFFPDSYYGINPGELTLAEALKKAGYVTGIVGKWHLGHFYKHLPLQNGFDEYFGIPYSNDMNQVMYMRGNEVEQPEVDQHFLTQTYTEEALRFIEKNASRPFFLYLPHNMPHVPIYASPAFTGTSARGLYGDVIQELDWSVGQVVGKLESLGILENTLVVFSSDNGPWLVMKELGGSAGKLREGKQYTFEGGMRVPTVAMWKGKVSPQVYDGLACMMDWFPTFLTLAGVSLPADRVIDGKDLSGVLLRNEKRNGQEMAYYMNGELRAYRYGEWKLKLPYPGSVVAHWTQYVAPHDTLLFNLESDPGEKNNRYLLNPEIVQTITLKIDSFTTSLGKLPRPVHFRGKPADHSHYEWLEKKRSAPN